MNQSRAVAGKNFMPETDSDAPPAWMLARVGERWFGVTTNRIWSIELDVPAPVPLPHAPPAILGISLMRQRAFTVLSLSTLSDSQQSQTQSPADKPNEPKPSASQADELVSNLPVVIALRGDAQLAFVAEAVEAATIESVQPVSAAATQSTASVIPPFSDAQYFTADGRAFCALDAETLFACALRNGDRRRRRAR